MLVILESFFVQMVFVFGFVILCGLFISLCNKCFYDACGDAAFPVVRYTGYVGTPVHEASHLLMCLLFGHTVTSYKLVNTNKRSRTLGYVEHTYYKNNLYHQIGNYFIGVSPIFAGGLAVLFFMWLFMPNVFGEMMGRMSGEVSVESFLPKLLGMADTLFNRESFSDLRFWLCIVFSFMVVIHMEISRSDMRSGLRGLGVLAAVLLLTDLILGYMFPQALTVFTAACVRVGMFSAFFLLLPSVFAGVIGFFSLCVLAIKAMVTGKTKALAVNHHKAGRAKKRVRK